MRDRTSAFGGRLLGAGLALGAALGLAGCTGGGQAAGPAVTGSSATNATTTAAPAADLGRFASLGYCPELRIQPGTQTLRRAAGGEDDPRAVLWQATIADTARECRYGPDGRLTIRVGVAGRVVAGPKGGAGPISAPVRIAVVRYQENVLATQLDRLTVTIPPELSTTFEKVYEVTVPAPGADRDYIVYVGFDEAGRG